MESKFAILKSSVAMTILFSSHVAISMLCSLRALTIACLETGEILVCWVAQPVNHHVDRLLAKGG